MLSGGHHFIWRQQGRVAGLEWSVINSYVFGFDLVKFKGGDGYVFIIYRGVSSLTANASYLFCKSTSV